MAALMDGGGADEAVAWAMTDKLVSEAQWVFLPVWEQTHGNNGYVSFELDPLLEDLQLAPKSIPNVPAAMSSLARNGPRDTKTA